MADPRFYQRSGPFGLDELAARVAFEAPQTDLKLSDIASLETAGALELGFFSNPKLSDQLAQSGAGAVLIKAAHADMCPAGTLALICDDPYRAMAQISQIFYPQAAQARHMPGGMQDGHNVHPDAKIGDNVTIAHNAIIGPAAEIGDGCYIGAGAIIGHGVMLGRDCTIGSNAVIGYALVGDRVIVHSGAAHRCRWVWLCAGRIAYQNSAIGPRHRASGCRNWCELRNRSWRVGRHDYRRGQQAR
jgi:UDP-3-O-[3-hydroxymyristoyl] glucosamine N-acyltransferase